MMVNLVTLIASLALFHHATAAPDQTVDTIHSSDMLDGLETAIVFPVQGDWWTVGTLNVVEWWWAQLANPKIVVTLNHNDVGLVAWAEDLSPKLEARMLSFSTSFLAAEPGHGYFLQLRDGENMTNIYATSDTFEIRPSGSTPIVNPLPYGPLNPRDLTNGAARIELDLRTLAWVGVTLWALFVPGM